MTTLQQKMNRLTDMDWGWWPVVRLRPSKAERMSWRTYVPATLIFGSAAAALVLLVRLATRGSVSTSGVLSVFCYMWLFYYFAYRVSFGRAWNARADVMRLHLSKTNIVRRG